MSAINRLLVLLLVLLPVDVWAATAHVKADQSRVTDAGHVTQNASFTGGITNTGDSVSGGIFWIPTTANLTGVTVCGNAATLLDNKTIIGTSLAGASFVYTNVSAGACTVTATWDVNVTDGRMVIVEASGVDTVTPVGTAHVGNGQNNPGSGANAITSTAITPPDNGRIFYGFTSNTAGSCTPTAGTDFTLTSVNLPTRTGEYYVQPTASSHAATFTGCNENWVTLLVALKDAAAGGGGPVPHNLTLMGVGQ